MSNFNVNFSTVQYEYDSQIMNHKVFIFHTLYFMEKENGLYHTTLPLFFTMFLFCTKYSTVCLSR